MRGTILKVIVLDFDGVIAETLDIKADAFAVLFADYPEHVEAIVRLHRENGGMSRYEKSTEFYGQAGATTSSG